jgi:signal transduction histidine kinase/ActR/RegA family two-component response regulator
MNDDLDKTIQNKLLRESNELVSAIAGACEEIAQAQDIPLIASTAYKHLKKLVSVDILSLGLLDEKTQTIEFEQVIAYNQNKQPVSTPLAAKLEPEIRCFTQRQPIILSESRSHNEEIGAYIAEQLNVESESIISRIDWPLISSDKVIGVMTLQSTSENAYSKQSQAIIRSLVLSIGISIKQVLLLNEMEYQILSASVSDNHVRIISEIGKEINSTLDLETVLWTVYQHVNKLMDATVFGIGIYDSKEELIHIDLAMEKGQRYKPYTRTMEIKNQFPVWCIENRKAVFVNDIRTQGRDYFEVNEYDNWDNNRPVLKDDAFSGIPLALIYVPMMLGEQVYGFITVQTFKTDAYKDVHVNILRSIAGYTVNAIANANAHQQLEKTKESLRLAKKEAEDIAKSKMRFLANMSHEIRTPMNIILGFMSVVLEHDKLSLDDKEHLATAHYAAKNLLTIIDDILDVTKNESGKLLLESISFDLFKLLTEAGHLLSFKAKQKGLDFQLDYSPELSHYYIGDPIRINQVILNLTGNAIKFTDSGYVKIQVCADKNSNKVLFSISDTGIGISSEERQKIFDGFTQADTSTTRNFGGTGLGTTISRQLVSAMKGDIWVESKQGSGSVFSFLLPLKEGDKSQVSTAIKLEHSQQKPSKSLNILLAEDTVPNAMLMNVVMRKRGHQLTIVDNGAKAIEAVKEHDFDIVFMDVQMPVMDGLTATREIRLLNDESKKNIPIIAMTASALHEDRTACFAAGMNEVQTKPIDFEKLYMTLNDYM